MTRTLSLRARLTAIILIPLMIIAALIGFWAVRDVQKRADVSFDRALLSAALAVSRDVAVSGGDALSPQTNALLSDTSGGPVFYHVYAPDGVFVTGYATPPVPIAETLKEGEGQQSFEGVHQSRHVRAVRFIDTMQIDGLTGDFTVTVWQNQSLYQDNVRDLSRRTVQALALLVSTVALVVWFGVRLGLRPLIDLENAIGKRSSSDLSPIKRNVPEEVNGSVETLNRLFAQVSRAMTVQSEFIGNAAHQLRNPIAGVLSLAEALVAIPEGAQSKERARDLLDAAQETADLSQKLLMLERADALTLEAEFEVFDLAASVEEWVNGYQKKLPVGVILKTDVQDEPMLVKGDLVMLREAFVNLIDNAVRHGGTRLSQIWVQLRLKERKILLSIQDDGVGIPPNLMRDASKRFVQLTESRSSGLGARACDLRL